MNTKKAVSFTIRIELLDWLKKSASSKKLNRSQLVERALRNLKEKEMKENLVDSFKRMNKDQEVKELAEMGLEVFFELNDE